MTRVIQGWLVALAVLSGPSATLSAQSDAVVALFERGLEAYRLANYEEAEVFFAQAHALEPLPDLSYNHARTLELLGRFGDAADVYTRFLREAPDADDREVIEARIVNLRAREARDVVSIPEPVVEEPTPVTAPTEPVAPVEPERRGPSLVGPLIFIGGGLAIGAAGIATALGGTSAHEIALDPSTSQIDSDSANQRATRLARSTNALITLGGAVLAAGVTWLVVKLARGAEDEGEVSLLLAPTGVVVRSVF